MKLTGNTVLITGGATGIGLELARALVARDNEVIICGRRKHRLEEAKQAIPQLHIRPCNVGSSAQRDELTRWATATFPKLNVLVNNAGVQHLFDVNAGTRDLNKADEEIAINLNAPIHLAALFESHLRRQAQAAIVNVTSGLAFAPLARMPVYCATKAALHSFTMSLRHQLRDTSVRVFEIIPPIVTSELGAAHRPPSMNATAMPVEDAIAETLDALEHDKFEATLGGAIDLYTKRDALFDVMNR